MARLSASFDTTGSAAISVKTCDNRECLALQAAECTCPMLFLIDVEAKAEGIEFANPSVTAVVATPLISVRLVRLLVILAFLDFQFHSRFESLLTIPNPLNILIYYLSISMQVNIYSPALIEA